MVWPPTRLDQLMVDTEEVIQLIVREVDTCGTGSCGEMNLTSCSL